MTDEAQKTVLAELGTAVEYADSGLRVVDEAAVRSNIGKLAHVSALGGEREQAWARYLTRLIALELGAIPASIHDLYLARGRGEVPATFTVPAMNLRILSFEAAPGFFRQ